MLLLQQMIQLQVWENNIAFSIFISGKGFTAFIHSYANNSSTAHIPTAIAIIPAGAGTAQTNIIVVTAAMSENNTALFYLLPLCEKVK